MGMDLLRFVGGLVLLLGGGEALVRGAAGLARRLGISPAIVGLTVVAFGTSAPELVVCLFAARDGTPGIAFGNIVGSNIANVGLLLGLTAMFRPFIVHSNLVMRELPMMLLASVAAAALFLDGALHGGEADGLHAGDGLMLALFFSVFIYYTASDVLRSRNTDTLLKETGDVPGADSKSSVGTLLLFVIVGAVGLAWGGNLMVAAATSVARSLGVADVVIAATVVAVGTSLPELATSILAAKRGEGELAVGNLVGSNIFNLLLVLGTTALVAPIPLPSGGGVDLAIMVGLAIILLPLCLANGRRVTRREGVLLVAIYGGFMAWQIMRPT